MTGRQSRAAAGAAVRYLGSRFAGVTRPCRHQAANPSPIHLRCFSAGESKITDISQPRLSVAVVGAGPSGFYTSKYLTSAVLQRIEKANGKREEDDPQALPFNWSGIDVDIFERLPTPYGLVRYGVAPDHPEVKNVEHDFAAQFETSNNNPSSSLSFFGGVEVGKDVSLSALQSMYDVVVLAYGCQAADRQLNIPGEDLEGVLSAREFVAWYNGHPEFGHIGKIVKECLWGSSDIDEVQDDQVSTAKVVVVGQGNVALDVARILAKGKRGLIETDSPSTVLEILKGGASHISVVGRRGHVQGAFTIKGKWNLPKKWSELLCKTNRTLTSQSPYKRTAGADKTAKGGTQFKPHNQKRRVGVRNERLVCGRVERCFWSTEDSHRQTFARFCRIRGRQLEG